MTSDSIDFEFLIVPLRRPFTLTKMLLFFVSSHEYLFFFEHTSQFAFWRYSRLLLRLPRTDTSDMEMGVVDAPGFVATTVTGPVSV